MKKRELIYALRESSSLVQDIKIIRRMAFAFSAFLLLITSGFSGVAIGSEKPPLEKQTIVFTTIFPKNMNFFSDIFSIYREAFSRMGYGFKLISQPGERAMIDANEGVVDGEAARIMNIDKKQYVNLIRVPHPIVTMQDGAYAIDASIKITGWKSLEGKPYRVGLLKGIKSIEQKLSLYVDKDHTITLSTPEQGMKMLKARRIDLFIVTTQVEDTAYMQSDAFKEVKHVGVVETKVLYPWLHKRHQHLAAPLAEMLKTLKAEGFF